MTEDKKKLHLDQPILNMVCGGKVVYRFRLKADKIQRPVGREEDLNQSLVNKHFVFTDSGPGSSANHLQGKEWECGGSVSGLITRKQNVIHESFFFT